MNMQHTKIRDVLELQQLEPRMMLSTVQIYAAGGSGQESLSLRVNDAEVATFDNVGGDPSAREYEQLNYQTDQVLSGSDIRLEFTNDLYDSQSGLDRNLFIDRIVIDGVTHQAEGPSVYSTGIWDGGLTGPGFLNTETLNINGSLFFSDANTPRIPTNESQIAFVARGTTGDEIVELRINDQTVKSFQLSQDFRQYQFKTSESIDLDQVKFVFVNDLFDPNAGVDRNVMLDFLELENLLTNETVTVQGNSLQVFSTGTWTAADGVVDGFGRGDTLHSNGFMRFADQPTSSGGSLIRFTASGDTGEEILQLLIDGNVYYEVNVVREGRDRVGNTTKGEYQVTTDQPVDLSQLRIAFVNDGVDQFGRDRNLNVGYIYIQDLETGETVARTTAIDNGTFSTGTFLDEDGVVPGFGRGAKLFTDGYFEFSNSSRLVLNGFGATNEERFRVTVDGVTQAEFLASEPTTASGAGNFYVVDFDQAVDIESIRVEYFNDGVDQFGDNRDLFFSRATLDGRGYSSETVFSTGTFLPEDGVVPGTGRGSALTNNGYFQFGAVADAGDVFFDSPTRFPPLVNVQWLGSASGIVNQSNTVSVVEENGNILLRLNRRAGEDGRLVKTYNILPFSGSIPGSINASSVEVAFEDGQLAALIEVSVIDNSVADGGGFFIQDADNPSVTVRVGISDND